MKMRATSFATRQDLAGYAKARSEGFSHNAALRVGDNGIGAWGDPTWHATGVPIVALPLGIARHNQQARVTVTGAKPFVAVVRDISPAGICDLNPAALVAGGFGPDTDLSADCAVDLL